MAGKHRRGKIWWISWATPAGRYRKSTGTTSEREAELLRRAKELELELGRPIIVDHSLAPTVAELSILYLQHQARTLESAARDQQAMSRLLPTFGELRIDQVERSTVKAWVLDRLETVNAGTVKRELATLRRMFSLAIEWGVAVANPAARIKVPGDRDAEEEIRWYSTDALKLLYDDPERGDLWKFYANTALRRSEGLNLKLANVEDDRIMIVSSAASRTKSRRSRVVPLNEAAKAAVTALRKPGASYLLPRLHPHTLTHYFTAYARSVGLDGSIHWLRHSFGHHWVKSGRSLRQLQLIMGHSSYAVTERYARLDTGELDVTGFEV